MKPPRRADDDHSGRLVVGAVPEAKAATGLMPKDAPETDSTTEDDA